MPVVAGIAQMSYRRFATYNVVGGEKVIVVVVFLSLLPPLIEYLRARMRARRAQVEPSGPQKES